MSTQNEKNYYDILEVSPTATLEEIKAARNLKLKFFHPDRYQHDPELRAEAERKTKQINLAYAVLSEPEIRAAYDRAKGYASPRAARLAELYDQALLLLSQHTWQGAIGRLEEIVAIDPDYKDVARLLQLARAAQEQQTRESQAQAATDTPAGVRSYCAACGEYGQTWGVTYRQNIGALVMRFHKKLEAELCRRCAGKYFWEFSLTTLFLGWWGVISAIVTPFFLLGNVISYLPSMTRGKRALFLAGLLTIPLLLCLWLSGAFQWLGAVLPDAFEPLGGAASNSAPAPAQVVMIQVTATPSPRRQDPTPLSPAPSRTPTRAAPTPTPKPIGQGPTSSWEQWLATKEAMGSIPGPIASPTLVLNDPLARRRARLGTATPSVPLPSVQSIVQEIDRLRLKLAAQSEPAESFEGWLLNNAKTQLSGRCIYWADVEQHVGKDVCVCGTVHHIQNKDNTGYIHFDADSKAFYAFILGSWWKEEVLGGRCVLICGEIETNYSRPRIEIVDPDKQLFWCE